jgi:glutathione S-transferase
MITIYHLGISRSERIIWLAEELGIAYRLEVFQRESTGLAPDALKAIHPLGKAPVIRDGETVLAESGAIVEYLVERYGEGRLSVPPAAANYPRYIYFMHFAEGSLMTLLISALLLSRVPESGATGARVRERQTQMLACVVGGFGSRPDLGGPEFTAAPVFF